MVVLHDGDGDVVELERVVGAVGEGLVGLGDAVEDDGLVEVGDVRRVEEVVVEFGDDGEGRVALEGDVVDRRLEALEVLRADGRPERVDERRGDAAGELVERRRVERRIILFRRRTVRLCRVADAVVVDARLQQGHGAAHVALGALEDLVEDRVGVRDVLGLGDVVEARAHLVGRERSKPILGAPRGERLDDARDVVADEAEARHVRVGLHGAAQRALRVLGHGVGLVENDDLERRRRVARVRLRADRALREGLDLLANHLDAALVRGVHLEHAVAPDVRVVEHARHREDRRRLARARRAIKQQVRQRALLDRAEQRPHHLLLRRHVAHVARTVLLHPHHGARRLRRRRRRFVGGARLLLRLGLADDANGGIRRSGRRLVLDVHEVDDLRHRDRSHHGGAAARGRPSRRTI
mmetsp:Transcript_11711/g.47286  ORF Transcript_11711/g.47286 Transcript_11711/m.47286 type:complete len:411 (-) Transcript_11711:24-1256(-)